jgi:hypothetical protein
MKRTQQAMIISVTISETVVREATNRGMSLEDFVDSLIDKGMAESTGRPVVSSAIDRIRALRMPVVEAKR